jgi:hypothetical protein
LSLKIHLNLCSGSKVLMLTLFVASSISIMANMDLH